MDAIHDVADLEVVAAESSPAETLETPVVEAAVENAEPEINLSGLTAAERLHWRKTGELPVKPVSAAPEKPAAETKAVSETDDKTPDKPKHRPDAGQRIAQLRRETKAKDATIAELQKKIAEKAEPATAPKTETAAGAPADPDELKPEDFPTLGEYAKALTAQIRQKAKDDLAASLKADREEQKRLSEESAAETRNKALIADMKPKFMEGLKRHADFRDAMEPFWDKAIQLPEAVTEFIFSKPHSHELLYRIGSDYNSEGELVAHLSSIPAYQAIVELEDMHREVTASLEGKKPALVPRVGKNPQNLAARTAAPDDDDALLERDPAAHRRLMNERQLAAMKARRGA